MKTDNFILSIDQGTTGTTAFILNLNPGSHEVLSSATVNFKQYYPKSDWVEHDLNEIWTSCEKAIEEAIILAASKNNFFKKEDLKTIGITNQRETLCVFSKDGDPLHPAIVWQCKRSSKICEELKASGLEPEVKEKTGLLLDPYFTGTKLKWLIDNKPDLGEKIRSGEALVGTIDTFLLYKLTGGKSFATEPSNASRTLLYNIKERKWDETLLKIMGDIPESSLPKVLSSNSLFGKTRGVSSLPDGISISGVLGDQHASLFGHACFNYGESKCTYGTGAFFLMNTEDKIIRSKEGLLTTVAWELNGKISYALEGSCFIAGAAVGFLRDNLGLIKKAKETGFIPKDTQAAPELYFVPALCGLGAPYWKPDVKGALLGLTRSTSKDQIIKACLEGICFQVEDLLGVFRKEASLPLSKLNVDGGACANEILMNTQAYLSNLEVLRPKILEATAYGAALIAAYGSGIIKNLENLRKQKDPEESFKVTVSAEEVLLRDEKLTQWKKAINSLM